MRRLKKREQTRAMKEHENEHNEKKNKVNLKEDDSGKK